MKNKLNIKQSFKWLKENIFTDDYNWGFLKAYLKKSWEM